MDSIHPAKRLRRTRAKVQTQARPADRHDDEAWRSHNVGRLLNVTVARFETRILELMDAAGYNGFSLSHITVTRNLDTTGTRAVELARRAGITKQSMGELIAQLEASGVVARRPDPDDRRSRIVYFTPAGIRWLHAFRDALQQAEAEMRMVLGERRLKALKQALADYNDMTEDDLPGR